MHKTTTLLASLLLALLPAAGMAAPAALTDESACLEQAAPFTDCLYAIQEAKTVVSTARQVEGSDAVGTLNITYIIAEFGALRDGMDPNVLAFLKFEYLVDGMVVQSRHEKIGSFLSFDGFTRVAPGKYLFSGKIFSDDKGCLAKQTLQVDATDFTVALRRNAAELPELVITDQVGDCD